MELKTKVFATWSQYSKEWHYHLCDSDMSDHGWVFVSEKTVIFEPLAHKEMMVKAAKLLKVHKQNILNEAYIEAEKVQAQIDEMLALEYVPEPA